MRYFLTFPQSCEHVISFVVASKSGPKRSKVFLSYPSVMGMDEQPELKRQRKILWPTRLILGALAIFGAITLLQWLIASLIGIVKLALLAVVVMGILGLIFSTKNAR